MSEIPDQQESAATTAAATESFTCNTCGLAFKEPQFQREHMKTEWHRYNLKRRVAGLPPIPSEIFAEKVLAQSSEISDKPQSKRQVTKKDLKRQQQAKKRLENMSRASSLTSAMSEISLGEPTPEVYTSEGEDDAAAAADPYEAAIQEKLANRVEFKPNVCFMDGHESTSVEENVAYLERKFGLVIPEPDYVTDLAGLVTYLNEKVGLGNCCLWCSFMGRSLEAARAHMVSKQHCKVPFETEEHREELEEFYEYGPTSGPADDGWEDTDEEGDGDYTVREGEYAGPETNGYELALAPGTVIGHRDLRVYYKQRHMPVKESEGRRAVRLIDNRPAGVTEKTTERAVKENWKQQKKADYAKLKHDKHINFQKHFRDPLLQ